MCIRDSVRVIDLQGRDAVGHLLQLGRPQQRHGLVVGGVVADRPVSIGLLDAADAVLQARDARRGPRPGQRDLVSGVGVERRPAGRIDGIGARRERRVDRRQFLDVGQAPRLGTVGEVAVGQQDDRVAVGDGQAAGLVRRVEAVRRRLGRNDRHRGLAVASVERLQQIGLLGLGGQTGRGAAALDVDCLLYTSRCV